MNSCDRDVAQPNLTKFLRLTIYGFFTFEDTVMTLALLSKRERSELLKSQIARENKTFKLTLDSDNLAASLLESGSLATFYGRIETRV